MAFDKKIWVLEELKNGFDRGTWSSEHIMELSMKYSMAGVLSDADLAEMSAYTTPPEEEIIDEQSYAGEEIVIQ